MVGRLEVSYLDLELVVDVRVVSRVLELELGGIGVSEVVRLPSRRSAFVEVPQLQRKDNESTMKV